ncbi:endonuclease III [Sinorhizobium meliloti]|uniref:Endonuclease III n=8 Tax=Rhizobium meliloti TaxID=382 RepID=Q92T20_RHIME|nr:endonuclease III [Sinorhizobium meliloti]PST29838.1 endonuclease III [Mesorhizobium loti]TWA92826.1 DNA-(apurinic or apyrimidinic site) lyase /endonuclease III [Ensifer sp. SEMIA 134]TWB28833.1 DNA-(apurinic or apyrimidinic site) lyase /endonuclease III [Ensifer sp. SEMIA 135]AEG06167.1 endonuclease III [Sinorhizobium meliloti BL225C]AEG55200.1 endonuclease III [Sinorhizobium meliloti AK83]
MKNVKLKSPPQEPKPAKATTRRTGGRTGPRSAYRTAEVEEIFRRFSVQRPEPKGELEHVNPFTLVVAVALSAQATDAGVNKATRQLFAVADTPEKMLALGEERVRDYIKTIGLYRNKAKNVIALSEKLIADFGGEVPRTREELVTLPGVGRKTANVVLSMAFGQPTMAVDTHIFRIANRIRLAPGKTPDEVEAHLLRVIPEHYLFHAHHWLILHGRYVCKARRPECERCVIADLCKSPEKTCDIPAPLVELPPQAISVAARSR